MDENKLNELMSLLESNILCVAEEFNAWLEDMEENYGMDKDEIQFLVKQFLI